MAFKLTRYLGSKRYESKCVKCKETLIWTEGEEPPVVFFQDEEIGFLCTRCYSLTRKTQMPRAH